jgi:hypothetical protein
MFYPQARSSQLITRSTEKIIFQNATTIAHETNFSY